MKVDLYIFFLPKAIDYFLSKHKLLVGSYLFTLLNTIWQHILHIANIHIEKNNQPKKKKEPNLIS